MCGYCSKGFPCCRRTSRLLDPTSPASTSSREAEAEAAEVEGEVRASAVGRAEGDEEGEVV